MNVLLLGPPGSGKGTQAKRLAQEYGLTHIGAGDLIRAALTGLSTVEEVEALVTCGHLVPDDLVVGLVRERLAQNDTRGGFVLDGFPRNLPQAKALDRHLGDLGRRLFIVFELKLPDAVCVERLLRRAGETGRVDDAGDVIARRLEIYHRETEPLVGYYRASGRRVVEINADRSTDDVSRQIAEAIDREETKLSTREEPGRGGSR